MASQELAHVRYFIDDSVPEQIRPKLQSLLHAQSAQPCYPSPSKQDEQTQQQVGTSCSPPAVELPGGEDTETFDVQAVTHIITLDNEFPGHESVREYNARILAAASSSHANQPSAAPLAPGKRGQLIAVVTPKWLTRTIDLKKRQEEQYYSPDPKKIFSGVVVCTEDLPAGDSETIKGVVSALGGQWRQALMVEVTHLVCTKQEGKKFARVMQTGWKLGMRAVLPHWIDDCIKLRARVSEDDYLFPNPPLLRGSIAPATPYLERLQEYLNLPDPIHLPNSTSALLEPQIRHWQKHRQQALLEDDDEDSEQIARGPLGGKRFYIADNCELAPERKDMYKERIGSLGGTYVMEASAQEKLQAIDKAHYVVVSHRDGWEFWKAYDMQKVIGNLDWLIHILFSLPPASNSSSPSIPSPTDRFLHYPWPREPAGNFSTYNITISGYTGGYRESLKRMIEYMGGKFEGNMTKNKTTHVIAAADSGDKVSHAKQWKLHIVNHLWIEDCFVDWTDVPLDNPRYTDFSLVQMGTGDATTMIGSRTLEMDSISTWASGETATAARERAMLELEALRDERMEAADIFQRSLPDKPLMNTTRPSEHSLIQRTGHLQPLIKCTAPASNIQPPKGQEQQRLSPPARSSTSSPVPVKERQSVPSESDENTQYTSKIQQAKAADGTKEIVMAEISAIDVTPTAIDADYLMDGGHHSPPESPDSGIEENDRAIEQELLEKPKPRNMAKRTGRVRTPPQAAISPEPAASEEATQQSPLTPAVDLENYGSVGEGSGKKFAKAKGRSLPSFPTEELVETPKRASRKAAENATKLLHDVIMPDVIAFDQERKGGGKRRLIEQFGKPVPSSSSAKKRALGPGRASDFADSSDADDLASDLHAGSPRGQSNGSSRKHVRIQEPPPYDLQVVPKQARGRPPKRVQPEPSRSQISSEISSFDVPPGKKQRPLLPVSKALLAGRPIRIASTGVPIEDALRAQLKRLNGVVLDDKIDGCTHIIVKGISRTVKFLTALALGAYFVTEQWAIDSVNQNQFLDEDKYILKDKAGEAKHDMVLARSLAQARRSKVLEDQVFYITPRVIPDFEALKTIAEAAGAAKVIKKLPTLKLVQDKADVHVVSSPEEQGQWENLAQNGVPVYSGEAIIKAVLQQKMSFEDHILTDD